MPDTDLRNALLAVRDLGLGDQVLTTVQPRCAAALQREIQRERRRGGQSVRRRRRTIVVPLSVGLVAAAGAAGYATMTSTGTSSAGIDCHLAATLDGGGTATHLDGRPATETCADLWASGAIAEGARRAPAPLHACVDASGSGAIHVFASHDAGICAGVGLREDPTAGADPASERYGRFAATLTEQLDRPAFACPTPTRLRQLVDEHLRARGLTDWTISVTGSYDPDRSCATLALDSDARVATISPVPR
jgi:hypothetical protein